MRSKTWRLVLASASPRRRDILKSAGFECTTFPSNSSESFDENLSLASNLCAIAETKVESVLELLSHRQRKGIIILGADTVVVAGERVLGKPKNAAEARRMLGLLSGKTHRVITSFSLFCPDEKRGVTTLVTTRVGFRKLSKDDIRWYVSTGEPFDKAGAYAIQGLAQQFVTLVDGDFLNVVGLPLYAVENELRKQGWVLRRRRKSRGRS